MALPSPLELGQAALRAGDWEAARSCFENALAAEGSAAAEAGLSSALFWLNRLREAQKHRERAYTLARQEGDVDLAARLALEIGKQYLLWSGDVAVARGWYSRAERLLEEAGPCGAHATLAIARGLATGVPDVLWKHAEEAARIARRFSDVDTEILALAYGGLALCTMGQVEAGMQRLDEAMAAATGGEVQDLKVAGEIYCAMLTACERAVDFERADQWCRAAGGYVESHQQAPMSASCRACYGSVLTATGRWEEAERELMAALRSFEAAQVAMRADALVRLATLRLREGRLEEAHRLLEGWEDHPDAQLPLAALHAARDGGQLAADILRRRFDQLGEHSITRAPLLALLARIQIGELDLSGARVTAAAIDELAARGAPDSVSGLARLTRARVQLAAGESPLSDLEAAVQLLLRAEMPFEVAEGRLLLAEALGSDRPAVARSYARQALDTFARLGAGPDRDRAAHVLQALGGGARTGPRTHGPLSQREQEVLRLVALGLSNEQIASRLFISRRTAEHHVSSILSKLELSSRAEAVAYAARHPVEDRVAE